MGPTQPWYVHDLMSSCQCYVDYWLIPTLHLGPVNLVDILSISTHQDFERLFNLIASLSTLLNVNNSIIDIVTRM